MEGLTTIHLGGKLGQLFGKRWDLQVSSPAEAIRAIDVNLKGELKKYLFKQGHSKFYKIGVGKKDALIGKEELHNRSGRSAIYIIPVAKGRSSGVGKILAGVAIIAAIALSGGFAAGGWALASGGGLSGWGTVAVGMSASMILGGVTQLLTPTPNFNQNSQGDSRGSNLFNGNAAAISQGGAVGLIYGRALVTPMPISVSFENQDQIKPDNSDPGRFCIKEDENGSVQYVNKNPDGTCPAGSTEIA